MSECLGIERSCNDDFTIIFQMLNRSLSKNNANEMFTQFSEDDTDDLLSLAENIVSSETRSILKCIVDGKEAIHDTIDTISDMVYLALAKDDMVPFYRLLTPWFDDPKVTTDSIIEAYSFVQSNICDEEFEWDYESISDFTALGFIIYLLKMIVLQKLSYNMDISFLTQDTEDDPTCKYKPVQMAAPKQKPAEESLPSYTQQQDENTADLLAQIESLKSKVREQESEIKSLRNENSQIKALQKKLDEAEQRNEENKQELAALREFAYNLDQNDEEIVDEIELDKMKDVIREKKIVIIGGHQNMIKRLKPEFPNWTFIATEVRSDMPLAKLQNQDMTFFFTDHICHAFYYKYLNMMRKHNIKVGYLHKTNVENVITQIYNEVK